MVSSASSEVDTTTMTKSDKMGGGCINGTLNSRITLSDSGAVAVTGKQWLSVTVPARGTKTLEWTLTKGCKVGYSVSATRAGQVIGVNAVIEFRPMRQQQYPSSFPSNDDDDEAVHGIPATATGSVQHLLTVKKSDTTTPEDRPPREFMCVEDGVFVIMFDNSQSWFRSATVRYLVELGVDIVAKEE